MNDYLWARVQEQEGVWILDLSGCITARTAHQFEEGLAGIDPAARVLLDIKSIDKVDSTGLGQIVKHHKRFRARGGDLRLLNSPPPLLNIFRRTNLDHVLHLGPGNPVGGGMVQAHAHLESTPKGLTILIIEDESIVLNFTTTFLEHHGHLVVQAHNGRSGLNKLESLGSGIDLILTDMSLPDLNSIELLEAIGRLRADAKIIISSGLSEDMINEAARFPLVQGTLQKPYRARELIETVERIARQ